MEIENFRFSREQEETDDLSLEIYRKGRNWSV